MQIDQEHATSAGQDSSQPQSVTRIGFWALGLSLSATVAYHVFLILINSTLWFLWLDSTPNWAHSLWSNFTTVFLFLVGPAAVTVDIVAGFQGKGNLIAGIIGVAIVVSFPAYVVISLVGSALFASGST